ncbi:hypothetical protein [Methylocystis echinoides]|uniref:hypothetical protein n=1 Tax=Methylocystis echinoides TaxID=29468 RepID=UPI00343C15AE
MNITLLFNSDVPKFKGFYGYPIREIVFGLGILQASKRHMKVSVGDIAIYSYNETSEGYDQLTERVYFAGTWSLLHEQRLRATFGTATVYALIFENMTQEIARQLHAALTPEESYLGLMEVDYAYGPHLALFRNSTVARYRIEGSSCRVFFSMGDEDHRDEQQPIEMQKLGYTDVAWENRGAHGTIFDNFDTIEHFERVSNFREAITPHLQGGADEAFELVMVLEDLNPQLFNALGSAVAALERAQNEEDIAQAAVSCRRYMERLADVLFPARGSDFDGRKVGKEQYKNRLWAFIAVNSAGNMARMTALGKEVDRLIKEFNAGLHTDQDKPRVLSALADAATLTAALLALNPAEVRKPYYAHQKRMFEFFQEAFRKPES